MRLRQSKRSLALSPNGSVHVAAASDGDFSDATNLDFVTVKYMSIPSLSIARSNGFAVLSWPAAFSNFQLQENTNVASTNSWSAVAQHALTNGNLISVRVPISAEGKYFRLKSE